MKFGSPLEGYGERYVKFSDKKEELIWKNAAKYYGEWSKQTNKPHGRGICISNSGNIYIQYWKNGNEAPGNYVS